MKFSNFLAVLFIAFLFVSNPEHTAHKAALNNAVKKESLFASAIGMGRVIGWTTTYEDYYLVSTSSIGGEVISVGVMGKVFVAPAHRPGP